MQQRFAKCMREQGANAAMIAGGGGVRIEIGKHGEGESPAFKKAQSACAKLAPKGYT